MLMPVFDGNLQIHHMPCDEFTGIFKYGALNTAKTALIPHKPH
jgi:hypothetical protein